MNEPELQAEEVKAARTARGWSQGELASIAGLSSHSIVSNVERGLRPGPEVTRRLREALGMIGPDGPSGPMDQKAVVTSE